MTGEHDYLLRVVVADLADFERIHSQHLTRLPSVVSVQSSFAMRTVTRSADAAPALRRITGGAAGARVAGARSCAYTHGVVPASRAIRTVSARLMHRLESWRLPRPDARQVINLSIAVLSALVIVLAVQTGWRSVHAYRQARQVAQVDAATNDFIAAAGLLELELTYGSALLGGERADPERLKRLHGTRDRGDLLWRRAMGRTRALAASSPMRADLLARHASAVISFRALDAARGRLEACLQGRPCGLREEAWQQAVSRVVEDSAAAREAVYFSVDTPERPARLYAAVERSTWTLADYTLRERGLMAFYLSADQQPTAAARAELARDGAVAGEAQESLRVFARLHRMDARVRSAIQGVDRSLTQRFTPLVAGVLSGATRPDAHAWLAETAPTVAALDLLSTSVEDAVAAIAADAMRESRNDMLFNGLFVLLACSVAALSATKVRQTASALFHQKELAEVTIRSIGDAVITTDDHGRIEYINPAAEQMTGWRSAEGRGLPLERVFDIVERHDARAPAESDRSLSAREPGGQPRGQYGPHPPGRHPPLHRGLRGADPRPRGQPRRRRARLLRRHGGAPGGASALLPCHSRLAVRTQQPP